MQGSKSQANGALMRIAPLAVYGHCMPPETLAGFAQQEARLTHSNQICQVRFVACLASKPHQTSSCQEYVSVMAISDSKTPPPPAPPFIMPNVQ